MTLYLYKIGTNTPVLTIENAQSCTADSVITADGTVYAPIAEDCELSSKPDCSEALRAKWRAEHPAAEELTLDLLSDHEERICMLELTGADA